MMSKYLVLLLIPIVYGQISIQITAGLTAAETSVEYTGADIAIISDTERESFNLDDRSLKDAVGKYSGLVPTDVFVKSPTPWEDVYHKFGWEQVQRWLIPIRSRVLGIRTRPIMSAPYVFKNTSGVKGKFNGATSYQVQETVTNSWSIEKELTIGQSISCSVNYVAGSIGGNIGMSFAARWGNETSVAKTVTLGASSGVEVDLNPGQSVLASITATHGTLDIEVDYEAHLTGQVFANYKRPFKGHMWWAYPVHHVLMAGRLSNAVCSTERISIGFFTSARIELIDPVYNNVVKVAPAGIISYNDYNY